MAKPQTVYVCSECGGKSAKWQGQCPHCQAWNTLTETVERHADSTRPGARHGAAAAQFSGRGGLAAASGPVRLTDVQAERHAHRASGIDELDRVLGGGLVPGGVLLLGGDPGIGKSTLLLQVLAGLGAELPVLYISGEESAAQVALRNRPLPRGLLAFGEVGLAGEIRPAPRGQERLREAAKLGFSAAIIPAANAPKGSGKAAARQFEGLELHPVSRIDEALDVVRGLG